MKENIYFIQYSIEPTSANEYYNKAENSIVSCWVKDLDGTSASFKAAFHVEKYDWYIKETLQEAIVVTAENFVDREEGLKRYYQAEQDSMAFFYTSNEKNITKAYEVSNPQSSYKYDLNKSMLEKKNTLGQGRCLHYDAGSKCNKIIKAHSIQKNGLLSQIAMGGNVYYPSANYGDFANNKNIFQKAGINRVSTFKGFCARHDNELFRPIDDFPFEATDEQVFLYAYRALSRELYVKEKTLNLTVKQLADVNNHIGYSKFYKGIVLGHENSLKSLYFHKSKYDMSLRENFFDDIKYVIFYVESDPMISFSGVYYPNYDFLGNELQYLGDLENIFDLITFFSVPYEDGWAFVFAWHKSSAKANLELMESFAQVVHKGYKVDDFLFRVTVLCCENIAFSPIWWESIREEDRKEISERFLRMADPFSVLSPLYLAEGLENIIEWKIDKVFSNMA